MKKNKFLKLASGLLMLVLITCCAVSGTFAKYVTSVEATDTARVARWGFDTASVTIVDLFNKTYTNVASDVDVIAPGTEGSVTVKLVYGGGNAPEVAYKLTFNTDGSSIAANIDANTNIVWIFNGADCTNFADMRTKIEAYSKSYAAGEMPAASEFTIGWRWDFSTDDAGDIMDTNMGNLASDSVVVKITITATQLN